jgi:hypothetical protein
MKLMSKQRRDALNRLTEENSPFVPNYTQRVFVNPVNLKLSGSTYDARHLDKFI